MTIRCGRARKWDNPYIQLLPSMCCSCHRSKQRTAVLKTGTLSREGIEKMRVNYKTYTHAEHWSAHRTVSTCEVVVPSSPPLTTQTRTLSPALQ
jgi:hypothetical protein